MGASLIDPSAILALLLMLLGSGVRDLAGCVSTDAYWKAKGVTVSVEQLIHELDPIRPADVSKLIADLDSDDPQVRDAASAKLAEVGAAALPALNDAAKNGSPEVVGRATGLLAKIRASSKAVGVRRLMAIRTLGERKEASAVVALRPLLDSKEPFEADYVKAAIARIEGKSYAPRTAALADRAADVALLPTGLDVVAQVTLEGDGHFSFDTLVTGLLGVDQQKETRLNEAHSAILKLLEQVGNVRLDAVTWGFYAAPPTQPGNTMLIARGEFDRLAVIAALSAAASNSKRVDGSDVFTLSEDVAVMVSADNRLVLLAREPLGDLAMEKMAAALKTGAGDFAADPDLPKLMKSVDTKAPLWAAAKIGTGMKEIVGYLADYDTATIVATQSPDKTAGTPVTHISVAAVTHDPAKAKQSVELAREQLKLGLQQSRQQERNFPSLRPLNDLAATIKMEASEGKSTLTADVPDPAILPGVVMAETLFRRVQ